MNHSVKWSKRHIVEVTARRGTCMDQYVCLFLFDLTLISVVESSVNNNELFSCVSSGHLMKDWSTNCRE